MTINSQTILTNQQQSTQTQHQPTTTQEELLSSNLHQTTLTTPEQMNKHWGDTLTHMAQMF